MSPSRRSVTLIATTALVALAAVFAQTASASAAPAPGRVASRLLAAFSPVRACAVARPGYVACNAVVARPTTATAAAAAATTPTGLSPTDIRSAYSLPGSGGGLIAVVDAFDDPRAESDLASYRSHFGLPACTTANGCFQKVNQSGARGSYPAASTAWGEEISLDLDAVSAACPGCRILLVEANSTRTVDLGAAIVTAVRFHPAAISNSYGAPETSGETAADPKIAHLGIALVASSGDAGYGQAIYPASSTYFTAVGGTTLRRASTSRGWTESVWGSAAGGKGTGSGCSSYEPKPSWQPGSACVHRAVVDVSADADPATGIASYDSFNEPGWQQVGGTSLAAPIVAATYALAGNTKSLVGASYAYAHAGALNDVTTGANGSCGTYLCRAGAGYDGPTGLGSPRGTGAF